MINIKTTIIFTLFCISITETVLGQRYYVRGGVGCTGIWANTSCWSTSSGGAGGASIPTTTDNAIFDANSFSSNGTLDFTADAQCASIDFLNIDQTINVTGGRTLRVYSVTSANFSFRWAATAGLISNFANNIEFSSNTENFVMVTPNTGTVNIQGTIISGTSNAATGTFSITGLSDKYIYNGGDFRFYSSFATFQGNTTFNGSGFFAYENCDFRNFFRLSTWSGFFCDDNVSGTQTRFFGDALIGGDCYYNEPTRFYGNTTITGSFNHYSTSTNKKMYVASTGSLLFTGDKDRAIIWESGINANGPVTLRRRTGGFLFQTLLARNSTAFPDTFNLPGGVIDLGDSTAQNSNTGGYALYDNPIYMTPNTNLIIGRYSFVNFQGAYDPDGGFTCGCWSFGCATTTTGYLTPRNTFAKVSVRPYGAINFNNGNSSNYFNTLSYTGNNLIQFSRQSSCELYEAAYMISNLVSSSSCGSYSTLRAFNPGTGTYSNPGPTGGNNATLSIPGTVTLPGTILQDITNASNNSLVGINASIDLGGNVSSWIRTFNPNYEWNNQWNGTTTPPYVFAGAFTYSGNNQTMYWIGKNNVNNAWSNGNNWSLTSGGPPIGTGCVPSTKNNVIFDLNSFTAPTQMVVLDGPYQYCKQMSWIIPPTASGVTMFGTVIGSNLQIWDDLLFDVDMVNSFTGTTEFNSETSTVGITFNTVFSSTKDAYNYKGPIVFKNQTTEWRLTSNLTSNYPQNNTAAILISNSLVDVSNNGTSGGSIANITLLGGWRVSGNGFFKPRTGTVTFRGNTTQHILNQGGFGEADFYNIVLNNPNGFRIGDWESFECCYDNTVYVGENGSMQLVNGMVRVTNSGVSNKYGLVFRENSSVLNSAGVSLVSASNGMTASPGGGNNSWIYSRDGDRSGLVYKIGDEPFVFPVGTATQYRPSRLNSPLVPGSMRFVSQYRTGASGWNQNSTISGGNIATISGSEFWDIQKLDLLYFEARCAQRSSNVVTLYFTPSINVNGVVLTVDGLDGNPFKVGDVVTITSFSNILSGGVDGVYSVTGSTGNQLSFNYSGSNVSLSCSVNNPSFVSEVVQTTRIPLVLPWKDGVTDAIGNYINGPTDYTKIKLGNRVQGGVNDGLFRDVTSYLSPTPTPSNTDGLVVSEILSTDGITFGTSGNGRFFTTGIGTITPLPFLSILDFDALAGSKNVLLKWEIKSAIPASNITIQRSEDAVNFTNYILLSDVVSQSRFSKVDEYPILGVSYYRLKLENKNGEVEYSQIKTVNFDAGNLKINIFPNPIEIGSKLSVHLEGETKLKSISVLESSGKIIQTVNCTNRTVEFPIFAPNGIYLLKVETENGEVEYRKVSVE